MNDLEIAKAAKMDNIAQIAVDIGIEDTELYPYGKSKAKISLSLFDRLAKKQAGNLILVTAMNPTPAGEGKTTTSIGLADALHQMDESVCLALREPSLGPVFGMKGGAAGGGYAQVVPMEDINLHFTGDLHAIMSANNLLCALIDNHIYQGNELNINPKTIAVKRCMDVNDRQLRNIVCGLGKQTDGIVREDGFNITAASEVMAILCMAANTEDLSNRLGNILVGFNYKGNPVFARQLEAGGAMAALLKEAIMPNLVQTLEHTPALIHGGPFANIAHGCNSIIATKMSMRLADYTITEAGFGADLGAEKFLDIKCRNADIWPNAAVLVVTVRALKYHGGVDRGLLNDENLEALQDGFSNMDRHIKNLRDVFSLPVIVAINRFRSDTDAELQLLCNYLSSANIAHSICDAWEKGGAGALDLAKTVKNALSNNTLPSRPYDYASSIKTKIREIAGKVYGAAHVVFSNTASQKIKQYEEHGFSSLPVCIAKTQSSFSDNAKKLGAPKDFEMRVRDVELNAGAGFIVAICGDIMRMPGLPKTPAANSICIDENCEIQGLF